MKTKHAKRLALLPPQMLGGSMWMIREAALPRLIDLARALTDSGRDPLALMDEYVIEPEVPEPSVPGVEIIPLTGMLTPHGSFLEMLFGGTGGGVQGFRDRLARAVANPNVQAIVLDVDSPGGSVGLVPEAAADVRAAREVKPVVAVANTLAASGAYYIASQASEFYVTPSGDVGSIGVYYLHYDWSRANDRMGIVATYVSAGKYKTEGNPDEPLSEDARAAWQADANKLYDMFVSDVATGRGVSKETVINGYGEGRVLLADDALAAGMVDGVATLQSVLARTLDQAAQSMGASARAAGRIGLAGGLVPLPKTDDDMLVPVPKAEVPASGEQPTTDAEPVATPPAAPDTSAPDPAADDAAADPPADDTAEPAATPDPDPAPLDPEDADAVLALRD